MMVAKQIWQAVKTRLRPLAALTQFADAAS
jgi:hypothetical protein